MSPWVPLLLIRRTSALLLLLTPCFAIAQDIDAQVLRDALLMQRKALNSFKGTYTYNKVHLENGHTINDEIHNLRFDGSNFYLAIKGQIHSKSLNRLTPNKQIYASWNGVISSFLSREEFEGPDDPPSGVIGLETWEDPSFRFLDMFGDLWSKAFGRDQSEHAGLAERLKTGDLHYSKIDEGHLLVRYDWDQLERQDFYFDSDLYLRRVDSGYVPPRDVAEEYESSGLGNIMDLFRVFDSIEIHEYKLVDGVAVPVRGTKTIHRDDFDTRNVLYAEWKDGRLTDVELAIELNDATVPMQRATIEFDVDSIAVNPELDKESFKIDFPPGTLIANKLLDEVVGSYSP